MLAVRRIPRRRGGRVWVRWSLGGSERLIYFVFEAIIQISDGGRSAQTQVSQPDTLPRAQLVQAEDQGVLFGGGATALLRRTGLHDSQQIRESRLWPPVRKDADAHSGILVQWEWFAGVGMRGRECEWILGGGQNGCCYIVGFVAICSWVVQGQPSLLLHTAGPSNFLRDHGDAHAAAEWGGEQDEAEIERSVAGVSEGNDGIAGKKAARRSSAKWGESMSD